MQSMKLDPLLKSVGILLIQEDYERFSSPVAKIPFSTAVAISIATNLFQVYFAVQFMSYFYTFYNIFKDNH